MADPSDGSTVVEDEVPTPSQDDKEGDIERAKSNHSARVEARNHDQATKDSLDQGYTNSSGGGKEGGGGWGGRGQLVRQWTLKIGDDKASSTILADQVCMDLRAGRPQALEKMKKAMLMGKLSINDQDEHFCPLILAAVQGGMAEATSELVFRGVDPSFQDNDKNTPLHVAYLFDHQDLVQFLISKGAKTTVRNIYNLLPSDMSMAGVRKLYFEATVVDDVVYLQVKSRTPLEQCLMRCPRVESSMHMPPDQQKKGRSNTLRGYHTDLTPDAAGSRPRDEGLATSSSMMHLDV